MAQSVTRAFIANGLLVIEYSDDFREEFQFPSIAGMDGANGAPGEDGADGMDGLPGAVGPQGVPGAAGAVGPAGATGAKGDTGAQGIQGVKGDTGATGAKGDTGATGPAGTTDYLALTNKPTLTDLSGILSIANGGTGASTAAIARANLGLGTSATLAASTSGNFRSNSGSNVLTPNTFWQDMTEVTVTYAASVSLNLGSLINGVITLTGNLTLANPTGLKVGQSGRIRIVQDSAGGRTISYGTYWKAAGGVLDTLSTAANAVDVLNYTVLTSTVILCWITKDVR